MEADEEGVNEYKVSYEARDPNLDRVSEQLRAQNNATAGVIIIPTSLTINEGESATYAVMLNAQPTGDVTVAVLVLVGSDVSVDDTDLTFTSDNWSNAQMVTVTVAQDEGPGGRKQPPYCTRSVAPTTLR